MEDELRDSPGLTGTVVRGAGAAGVGHAASQALTLGAYLVLARLATPADFGDFAAGSVLVTAGLLFTESGMLAALIHRKDRLEVAANTALVATGLAGVGLSLLALAASPLLGAFFDSARVSAIGAAVSGLILLRSLPIVPEALLQRRFSFLRRAVAEPAAAVAFGIAAIIAASHDLGPWALVIGYYAAAVVDLTLSWGLVRWRPRLSLASYPMWRELVAYGRHVLAGTAVLQAGSLIPTALLGRFVGAAGLGQFRYANRMSETPFTGILAACSWVLFPAFARIAHDPRRMRDSFRRSLRALMALAFPTGMVLLPLGVPIAVLVFGPVWHDAGEAAMVLCLFTAGASLSSIATEAFKATGRPQLLVRTHAWTVAAASIAMVALLRFDLIGVAAGVTIGALVGGAYGMRKVAEVLSLPIRALARDIAPPLIASAIMCAALFAIEGVFDADSHPTREGLAILGGELLIAVLVYVPILLGLSPSLRQELRRMIDRPNPAGPATTVVIPAYNGERTIGATIDSVLAQTVADLTVIVVDDGSTDDTVAVVRERMSDARVQLIAKENGGVASARNAGVAGARTDYVSFLDNDDLWMPEYVREMVGALEADPRAGFAFADGWWFDDVIGRFRRGSLTAMAQAPGTLPDDPEVLLRALAAHNFIWGSVTVRRSALEEVGGFDPEVNAVDDYDMWLRIVARGHTAVRPSRPLIIQRYRAESVSRDQLMMTERIQAVCAKLAKSPDISQEVRAVAQRRVAELGRAVDSMSRANRSTALLRRVRQALIRTRETAFRRCIYRSRPPSEVTAALGDIRVR
jgi:O-antigen/teichoic acid export membrane protein